MLTGINQVPSAAQQQQQERELVSTPSSASAVLPYPAVSSPMWPGATKGTSSSAMAPSPWDTQSVASSATTYPRIHGDYARSESSYSVGTLSRTGSGDESHISGVTELVRASVNFRTELEQLLSMLSVAEKEAGSSVSFLEKQIEEVAKVRGLLLW
jgi:hypothetical protein